MSIFKNKNFLGRLLTILLSTILFLGIGTMVVLSEREKKLNKTREYYAALEADWQNYKNQYKSEVERIKAENEKAMAEAKAEYDRLLSEQQKLIAEHSRTVAEANTSTSSNGATVSSNSQNITQTIRVVRPRSRPTTGATS